MCNQNKKIPCFFIDVFGIHFKVFGTQFSSQLSVEKASLKDPNRIKNIHTHFAYEMFFVTDGKLELFSERGITVYERKIVIIPPKIKHFTASSSTQNFGLLFSIENSKNFASSSDFQKVLTDSFENSMAFELPLSEDNEFYVKKISEKLQENSDVSEKETELLISLIFHDIVQMIVPNSENTLVKKNNVDHISAIESYVNSKFNEKIRLSDISNHVFLSTKQVSRIIQKEYGCTLSELVTEKKLAYAEILIKNTDLKISEIVHQTNFGSENYFYSLFKRHYGMSPLRFRKEYQRNNG